LNQTALFASAHSAKLPFPVSVYQSALNLSVASIDLKSRVRMIFEPVVGQEATQPTGKFHGQGLSVSNHLSKREWVVFQ